MPSKKKEKKEKKSKKKGKTDDDSKRLSIGAKDVPSDAPRQCQLCNARPIAARVTTFNVAGQWWCKPCVQAQMKMMDSTERECSLLDGNAMARIDDDVWSLWTPTGSGGSDADGEKSKKLTRRLSGMLVKSKKGVLGLGEEAPPPDYCASMPHRCIVFRLHAGSGNSARSCLGVYGLPWASGAKQPEEAGVKALLKLQSDLNLKVEWFVVPGAQPHCTAALKAYASSFPLAKLYVPSGRFFREAPDAAKLDNVRELHPDTDETPSALTDWNVEVVVLRGLAERALPNRLQQPIGSSEEVCLFHMPTKSLCTGASIALWHPLHNVSAEQRAAFDYMKLEAGAATFNSCTYAVFNRSDITESLATLMSWQFTKLLPAHSDRECFVRFGAHKLVSKALAPLLDERWQLVPMALLDIPHDYEVEFATGWESYKDLPADIGEHARSQCDVAAYLGGGGDGDAANGHASGDAAQADNDEDDVIVEKKGKQKCTLPDLPKPPARRVEGDERRGVCALQGRRDYMEDRERFVDSLLDGNAKLANNCKVLGHDASKPLWYAGVYDGHSGQRASDFLREHLHVSVAEALASVKADAAANKEETGRADAVGAALVRAFRQCDKTLCDSGAEHHWDDGSTCVIACGIGSHVYVANSGDSECILAQRLDDGKLGAIELSHRWKPSDAEEKARISAAGGIVLFGRVGGEIAVSRGFGDRQFKLPASGTKADLISCDPHIAKHELSAANEFIIVACDGLWDVLSHEEAIRYAAFYRSQGSNATEAATKLAELAMELGSNDNITVLLWYLGEPARTDEEDPAVARKEAEEAKKKEREAVLAKANSEAQAGAGADDTEKNGDA